MANDGFPPTARHGGIHGPIPDKNSPTQPHNVKMQTETMLQAAQLRAAGATFREIGEALGIDHTWARTLVLKALTDVKYEAADTMRTLEGARLDRLQRAHWAAALGGDVQSTRLIIQVMERRARLFGLDAPTRVEAEVIYSTSDIDAEVAELARLLEQQP